MAPQIDFMVKSGLLDPEAGKNHPDRNCLTSVILGDRVAKSDCPKTPFELQVGDIVVVSSDGLQYLEDERIQKILHRYRRRKSAEICGYLLEAIEDLADPDQDNCSFSVIKLNHNKPVIRAIRAKPIGHVETHAGTVTRVVEMNDDDQKEDAILGAKSKPVGSTGEKISSDLQLPPVIKEVKPIKPVDSKDGDDKTKEVDEATPPAKLAAGGK